MNCLFPIEIPKPGLVHKPMSRVPRTEAPFQADNLIVPCGKCINCVKNRQNNFAVRIVAEAEAKGNMSFVTLTYNDDSLPLVSTLWRVSKDTGDYERMTDPDFVCYSRKEDFYNYRGEIKMMKASSRPRYFDLPVAIPDNEYDYFVRITPSVCRKDVQLWIKSCRNWLVKNEIDTDWSYACCSEFGPRSCRPHYHICIFGLDQSVVEQLCCLWTYGFWYHQRIKCDDFSKVASYVGKYVSKGVFECDSVKCGAASKCRMMTSVGLGRSLINKVKDYMCAFDLIGAPYDLDTFFIPSKARYLRRDELVSLSSEIPKRLSVSFDGKRYFAIPRVIRNKVFYVKKVASDGSKKYNRPSRLWKMVVDAIQKQYADLRRQEFEQFLSCYSKGKVSEAVAEFERISQGSSNLANDIGIKNYQTKLSKSQF